MTLDPQVFISYSSQDKAAADAVREALENASLGCWIAPRDITPGRKYAEAILDGIDLCKVFLLVHSAYSNSSPQVEMEVNRAAGQNKFILSFRLDHSQLSKSLEYYLGNRHWLEASNPPDEQSIQALISAVHRLLSPAVSEPDLPPTAKIEQVPPARPQTTRKQRQASPASASVPSNPFTFGNPIKEPDRFYGRKAEIRQIINRLLSSAHESTSIVGERRIGKTSLLSYLSNPAVAVGLGLEPDKFCMVYVDFQGLTDITPQRFWQRVLGKMAHSVCDKSMQTACLKLSQQAEFDLFDLEDLFESISNKNLTTVLLMDEFEYVTQNPNFKGDFFGGLRSLAIHHRVALVPATRRELVELCHSDEIKGSPFFNIFVNVVLRPFTRQEVDDLLTGYTRAGLSSAEKDFVWNLGGGYPQFLQTAGYYLLEAKLQELAGEELVENVTGNFYQQADSHYSYMWSHCSESEKITLLIILTLVQQKPSKKTQPTHENLTRIRARVPQDLSTLSKRGLIYDIEGSYHIFSPSFEKWIRNELLTVPGEEESQGNIEQWLKSNNRGNLKDANKLLPTVKKKYWNIMSELIKDFSIEFAVVGVFEIVKFAIGIR
jgi:AAA+ ATPase superfamily predicted ATPase